MNFSAWHATEVDIHALKHVVSAAVEHDAVSISFGGAWPQDRNQFAVIKSSHTMIIVDRTRAEDVTATTGINNIEEIEAMPPFPFPNLGDEADNVDEVYERVDSLFCDSSGFGGPGEPALTIDQLKRKLTELIDEHGEIFVGIESTGQFQLDLAVWKEKAG